MFFFALGSCGGGGTRICRITCIIQTSSGAAPPNDIGPYYNETGSFCESERAKAQEELVNWKGVCTADFDG